MNNNLQLRPYQLKVFNQIAEAMNKGYRKILVVMPCRSGKTPLATAIINQIYKKFNDTIHILFNVHRSVLIEQTDKTFTNYNINHGIYSPFYKQTNHRVQIGSVLTVYKRKESIPRQQVILSDECHRDLSFTRKEIIKHFDNSILIGFTATPYRLSGEPMGDIYEIMILGPSPHELIKQGYLCDYKLYVPPSLVDTNGIPVIGGEYNRKQLDKITNKPHIIGDAIEHYKSICYKTRDIIFCTSIEHAEHTAKV